MKNKENEIATEILEQYFEYLQTSTSPISEIEKKILREKDVKISRYYIIDFMKNKGYNYDRFSKRWVKYAPTTDGIKDKIDELFEGNNEEKDSTVVVDNPKNNEELEIHVIEHPEEPFEDIPLKTSYEVNKNNSKYADATSEHNEGNLNTFSSENKPKKIIKKYHFSPYKSEEFINNITKVIHKLSEDIENIYREINEMQLHYLNLQPRLEYTKSTIPPTHKFLNSVDLIKINLSDTERCEITLKKELINKIKEIVIEEYMSDVPLSEVKLSKVIETALLDYYFTKKHF